MASKYYYLYIMKQSIYFGKINVGKSNDENMLKVYIPYVSVFHIKMLQQCVYYLVRLRHKKHSVSVGKLSCFGLKFLRFRQKILFCCHKQGWKLSKVPSGVKITNVENESTNVSISVFCRNINCQHFILETGLKNLYWLENRTNYAEAH